ncbi:hypothetical protein [Rhodobacter viridis]|nr:hypothetical protein [Rhodobacter viridis]
MTDFKAEATRRANTRTDLSPTERRVLAGEIETTLRAAADAAEKAKAAAAVEAETAAERARIATVIRAGSSNGRPRQAARLALSTPISAEGAAAVLMTLPTDAAASPEALVVPTAIGTFGTQAAVTERRRIASILGHAEAEGRFPVAAALAVETALDLGQALAALTSAPKSEARKYPTLAERSAAAGSFGPLAGGADHMTRSQRVDAIWSKAVNDANASIGAVPAAPEARPVPLNPSMTEDEATALRGAGGLAGGALADLAKG